MGAMLAPDQTRQQAVFDRLRAGIMSGALAPGARLPPTRAMAAELGVARQTVVLAYERLAAEGYVRGRIGSGTYVAADLPDAAPAAAPLPQTAAQALSQRGLRLAAVPVAAAARDPNAGLLLAGGLPAPDLFPAAAWARCTTRVLKALPPECASYPPPQGLHTLRCEIAAHLAATRGRAADPGGIALTSAGYNNPGAKLIAIAVHPGGLSGTLANLGHVGSSSNVNVIAAWASPDFHPPSFWLPLAALLAGLALLLPAMWRRRRYADAVLLVGASIAMLYAVRFLPYLMLVLALRGAEYLPSRLMLWSARGALRRSQLLGAVAVIALCAVLAPRPLFPVRYPVKAFSWLRSHHVRNVFNSYAIGSTLEAVGLRPYLDGRDNLWLQRRWWPQYVAVSSGGESVLTYLRRFDPHARYVLWFARSPVAVTLDASADWRRVLVDPDRSNPQAATMGAYVIWQRVGP